MDKTAAYEIIEAKLPVEIKAARELFIEYSEWLNVSLCFQNFDDELATLPGKYASPEGRLYLVKSEGKYMGCIAIRKIEESICEMKRLYLQPDLRGLGLGKKLVDLVIQDAKN